MTMPRTMERKAPEWPTEPPPPFWAEEPWLTRRQTAIAVTKKGLPLKSATLATWATTGGGPPYHKWGRNVRYRMSEVLAWAESRLTGPMSSSSEGDAR